MSTQKANTSINPSNFGAPAIPITAEEARIRREARQSEMMAAKKREIEAAILRKKHAIASNPMTQYEPTEDVRIRLEGFQDAVVKRAKRAISEAGEARITDYMTEQPKPKKTKATPEDHARNHDNYYSRRLSAEIEKVKQFTKDNTIPTLRQNHLLATNIDKRRANYEADREKGVVRNVSTGTLYNINRQEDIKKLFEPLGVDNYKQAVAKLKQIGEFRHIQANRDNKILQHDVLDYLANKDTYGMLSHRPARNFDPESTTDKKFLLDFFGYDKYSKGLKATLNAQYKKDSVDQLKNETDVMNFLSERYNSMQNEPSRWQHYAIRTQTLSVDGNESSVFNLTLAGHQYEVYWNLTVEINKRFSGYSISKESVKKEKLLIIQAEDGDEAKIIGAIDRLLGYTLTELIDTGIVADGPEKVKKSGKVVATYTVDFEKIAVENPDCIFPHKDSGRNVFMLNYAIQKLQEAPDESTVSDLLDIHMRSPTPKTQSRLGRKQEDFYTFCFEALPEGKNCVIEYIIRAMDIKYVEKFKKEITDIYKETYKTEYTVQKGITPRVIYLWCEKTNRPCYLMNDKGKIIIQRTQDRAHNKKEGVCGYCIENHWYMLKQEKVASLAISEMNKRRPCQKRASKAVAVAVEGAAVEEEKTKKTKKTAKKEAIEEDDGTKTIFLFTLI